MVKKIIINNMIIMIAFVIVSCTEDDDGGNRITGVIIGFWDLDYYVENSDLIEDIKCNGQLEYRFFNNGTYTLTSFAGDDLNNCQKAAVLNGTWEFVGRATFELLVNRSESTEEIRLVFHNNFTKFSIVQSAGLTEVHSRK
ncbi:hypothetical protein [Sinomicrobium pectinilyticum]|uniref:Lipocalin-like domain-containing protein n=1 Tax=Sinomicrobium pectinilyticum TaxID=1084421 RepID=A0A3N0DRF0_SINP1|nr:hypothetical protein [Sinomicrobium pectinilyticum]RNL77923.1 hypothetical protein ED312_20385 [Sinomicrobium pectinilyticum]